MEELEYLPFVFCNPGKFFLYHKDASQYLIRF